MFRSLRDFLADRFNLDEDKADELKIVDAISRDVNFKGTNLWTLIFAIFIASIGLNVNSTAVIIGAMLISPLMGPIMGIGLGIAINDFDLLKRGAKNLFIASFISVVTSTLYFAVTPLHEASSELLARTNPSLWDVFIAFFGGLAGIVAGTRKEKSNVIPGVAIATALMPPLCTAGYGIATGQWFYFIGAFYLFFINCLFICLATFLIVKHLNFHKKQFASPELARRVSRSILIIVIATILPSIYLAYRIVQRSIFENAADKFIEKEFNLARTQVITHTYIFDGKRQVIDLVLIGQPLSDAFLDTVKSKMPSYNLYNTELTIHQGLDAKQRIDLSEIRASILEDVFKVERARDSAQFAIQSFEASRQLKSELKVLYPGLQEYSCAPLRFFRTDTSVTADTTIVFVGKFKPQLSTSEKKKLNTWLQARLKADTVKCLFE
jgi:uncharacterized hydrophobic protein (TIGR00271 family)